MKFFVLLPKEYFLNQKPERTKASFISGADYGYDSTIVPMLDIPEYQIHSGTVIQSDI